MKPQRKPHFKPLATALAATLQIAAIAAVPVAWTNSPGMPPYPIKPVPHGSTVDLAVTLKGYTTPPIADGADVRLWYQTNGMGSAWWSAPATFDGSTITASFGPAQDCGADRVSLFFGAPSNVFASAVLRLTHAPGFSPANPPPPSTFTESDPVFTAWLADFSPTNHTHATLTDGTNTITASREVYETARADTGWTIVVGPPAEFGFVMTWLDADVMWGGNVAGWYWFSNYTGPSLLTTDIQADSLESAIHITDYNDNTHTWSGTIVATRRVAGKTYPVGRLALTNDLPDTAAIEREVEDLRTESAIVYRLYSGSNVVAEVTNYNSAVHAPELRLMQLNESNEYITVWTETNGLARTLAAARQYTDDATNALPAKFAPRAWGRTTAGMGVEAPSNTTWLSTARTVIAGGLDYEKHVTSGGAIWLLESNGMTPDFHPQTNNTAFLDLANADGTPIFRVEKTDSFLVGVHIDDVTVDGDTLVCSVGVVAAEHPLVRVRASLSSGEWIKEEDGIPAALATVTWSGSTGNWTCRIQNNTGGGQFFAQMEYLQEGGTKIVNSAPMSVSAGILCTDGIHKCQPVYSNGSITWEVVP